MQKTYNTIIVGGGASGLMSAIELLSGKNAISGGEVLILERNDRVGKKLLATGNGQGNLMNQNFGTKYYHGEKKFIEQFVLSANEINLENYLKELGIPLITSSSGKMYPLSKQASAVLDIFRAYLAYKKCEILTGKKVHKIEKSGEFYLVHVGIEKFFAKNIVFAAGGMAGKQFGTDGSAYSLIEHFGHKKSELYPSLVQLKTETAKIKGLKGLKETARVTSFDGERPLMTIEGDLLFTDYGVSGSTIFSLSSSIANKKEAYLIIEFLPSISFSETERIVADRLSKPYFNKDELLAGILNKKIGQAILKCAKSMEAIDIAYAIKNFKLMITGSLDFSYAQVTRGGILTDKIDPITYQSKNAKGLYVVGEALDIDGDCGGYNLTFAFISAIIAARNIKDNLASK